MPAKRLKWQKVTILQKGTGVNKFKTMFVTKFNVAAGMITSLLTYENNGYKNMLTAMMRMASDMRTERNTGRRAVNSPNGFS